MLAGQEAAEFVLSALPPDQAEVVLLRVLGDLDAEQVAAIMGRSANWVRVTQHRALRKLADRTSAARSGWPRETRNVMVNTAAADRTEPYLAQNRAG